KRGFEALQGRKTKQHSLSKLLVRSEGVYSGLFLSGNEIIHLNHLW
ncbi:putative HMG-I and HMG-Y, DNA-binding domain-containing protein, partial [Listeria seeligeri FSL S4-171]